MRAVHSTLRRHNEGLPVEKFLGEFKVIVTNISLLLAEICQYCDCVVCGWVLVGVYV